MSWKLREWTLVSVLLLVVPVLLTGWTVVEAAQGTIATTLVSDTVYHADGTPATGTVIVSWSAFTTASGQSVPSGNTSATIGAGGALSIALAPNAGATPMGSYYTAVYHLDDGSVSREYWVVPVSSGTTSLSAIKSQVLPTSVAMQTVSKAYVDTAIAAAVTGHPLDSSTPYVLKAGDTMTGPLVLPADPTSPLQAADKHYVDINVSASAGGLAQKVSLLPSGTQIVSQPTGTQLQVNLLNGEVYASQYTTGIGGNGIANALASPDCANGCNVEVDPSYASAEGYGSQQMNSSPSSGTYVEDTRGGARIDSHMNPVSSSGVDAGESFNVVSTQNTASIFAQGGAQGIGSFGLVINHSGLTGGSNLFPASLETPPYFKTGYSALAVNGTYNTQGEHVLSPSTINCYGVGDCLIGSQFLTTDGGFRDEADEGTHPFDIQIQEDSQVFQGTCSVGCSTGSTVVTVSATSGNGTQGDGRYLIDKNPAKVLSSGSLIGGGLAVPSATADVQWHFVSGEHVFFYGGADSIAVEQHCAGDSVGGDYDERCSVGICDEYGGALGIERCGVRDGPADGRLRTSELRDGKLHGDRRHASADDAEQGPRRGGNNCSGRSVRVWTGAEGRYCERHSPGVPGDWVILGDGVVLCGRFDANRGYQRTDERVPECESIDCSDCAQRQCGDGDDLRKYAGGFERSDADCCWRCGFELQRQLRRDDDRTEHVDLCGDGSEQHQQRRKRLDI